MTGTDDAAKGKAPDRAVDKLTSKHSRPVR
jgi:hypothetical protein